MRRIKPNLLRHQLPAAHHSVGIGRRGFVDDEESIVRIDKLAERIAEGGRLAASRMLPGEQFKASSAAMWSSEDITHISGTPLPCVRLSVSASSGNKTQAEDSLVLWRCPIYGPAACS